MHGEAALLHCRLAFLAGIGQSPQSVGHAWYNGCSHRVRVRASERCREGAQTAKMHLEKAIEVAHREGCAVTEIEIAEHHYKLVRAGRWRAARRLGCTALRALPHAVICASVAQHAC